MEKVALGLLAVVAIAGVVALAPARESSPPPGQTPVGSATGPTQPKVVDARVRASHLLVVSGDSRRIVVPASFCAPSNGEPVALACAVGPVRPPEGPKLQVRPGKRIALRFGTSVESVSLRYQRATKDGRVIALTYSMPLRSSSDDGLSWRTVMSRDPALHRARTIAVFSVAYRDAVRLALPTRVSKSFTDATAEFAVPLSVSR